MTFKRKLRPCMDLILVRLKDTAKSTEVKTDWGFVTEIKKESQVELERFATQEAYVVSLGPWAYGNEKPECKEGDLVLIARYSGENRTDLDDEGGIYRLVLDKDIFGVFDGESEC